MKLKGNKNTRKILLVLKLLFLLFLAIRRCYVIAEFDIVNTNRKLR